MLRWWRPAGIGTLRTIRVMAPVEDYIAAGLYEPVADVGAERFALLEWLDSLGFTIAEMQAADAVGELTSIAGDRRIIPGERLTHVEAVPMSGLASDVFDAVATALGFVPIGSSPNGELEFTSDEVDLIEMFGSLPPIFSMAETLGLARVIGSSIGRIGDAAVSLFLADVEDPHITAGESWFGLARKVYDTVGLLDGLSGRLDPILRRQVLQAIERTRRASIGLDRRRYRYAVGFVDLVGFTERSADMSAAALATFIRDFEGRAHDVMTRHGARVAKLIGDEVMFVATDPSDACRAAGAMMRRFGGDDDGVVPRGGIAYGDVLVRGGDYYGSVVNLASRLVDEAVPAEVLVTEELAAAASPLCAFEPAGRRMVKGFPTPIVVSSLVVIDDV